jgi:hypothetical protein
MTQKEKDLLLKDLCARLPYGVKYMDVLNPDEQPSILQSIDESGLVMAKDGFSFDIVNIKPYLFPLSSMTEEQKEFIKNKFCYNWDIDDHPYSLWAYCIEIGKVDELIDWFLENHFDYRGLIPMGLANDASELNIY